MRNPAVLIVLVVAGATTARADVVAHFQTVMGDFDVQLYEVATPITVANFVHYVTSNRYDGTFIHRAVPGSLIQGGGYRLDSNNNPSHISTFAPIVHEGVAGRPNVRGTIAMARQPDPNSATSEFFFNLVDNSADFDVQSGGMVVFGRVLGNGMDVVDSIAAMQILDASGGDPGSPFKNLPVRNWDGQSLLTNDNLAVIQSVTIVPGVAGGGVMLAGLFVPCVRRARRERLS